MHKSIEEEKSLSEKLLEFEDKNPPFISRLADKVAGFGGSWKFIIGFLLLMLLQNNSRIWKHFHSTGR